jgi:hypothetical protein
MFAPNKYNPPIPTIYNRDGMGENEWTLVSQVRN